MSNSIIDQQKDNDDFVSVFCSTWSPWLGIEFDRQSILREMRINVKEPVVFRVVTSSHGVEALFREIQTMLGPDHRKINYNRFEI